MRTSPSDVNSWIALSSPKTSSKYRPPRVDAELADDAAAARASARRRGGASPSSTCDAELALDEDPRAESDDEHGDRDRAGRQRGDARAQADTAQRERVRAPRPSRCLESSRLPDHVADAAHGVDQLRIAGLATEVPDVHLERVGRRTEVVVPHALVDLAARQHQSRRSTSAARAARTPSS